MGGSSSQPRTNPPLSPINAFSLGDLYTPQLSNYFQENTGYWQQPNPDDSPIEQVATSPTKKKKATRNRQKRVNQTEPAPRQTAWTTEEEIMLAKGWRSVFENIARGNARKKDGFWVEVLEYIESKTKQEGRRTYDVVVGKWKVARPAVVRFCGIYSNVMRMAQESGAGDEDYIQKAMIHYQAECSQGSSKRQNSSGSSSFNAESGDASMNLNNTINNEDDVQEIRRPDGRDKSKNKGMTPELHRQIESSSPYDMIKELKAMFEKQAGVESSSCIFTIELFSFPNKSWVYDTGCGTHIFIIKRGFKEARKLKQGALYLYVGNGVRAQVEAIGSYDLVLPNGLVICLDNFQYAPSITRDMCQDKVFKNEVENQLGKTIKALRSDQGGEYISQERDTPEKLQQRSVKCIFIGYPKETMGYYFYFPPENKIVVARYVEFFEKNLITQEVSGRAIDLEEIQDEDTSPYEITSEIPVEVEGFKPPQEEEILIRSYKAAILDLKSNKWIDAMNAEIQSMMDNMDGIVYTYKARLVAKGYTQLYEVDYEETFSPVADIRAIRILISIAAYYDYEILQMNVKTAFINGYLDEDIYMVQPEGFVDPNHPRKVSELRVDCYCDSGFETDRDDAKSQTGHVFILNGGAVDWKSSKQSNTAMYATEVEYIAASKAAMEAV
nr:hypothetical protein [Tanacetum cinerariifolium]